ncbi:MAG: YraN family protein [Muribaculum sp.]|nr:YraN family protein [Muribaculum sp.]
MQPESTENLFGDEKRMKADDAKDFGRFGEEMARAHLISEGYAICETNWRINHLELDIIAQLGDTIVFVEVKSRNGKHSDPLDSVTPKKIKNMISAAKAYMKTLKHDYDARFDIITLVGSKEDYILEHIPDAFLIPLSNSRF